MNQMLNRDRQTGIYLAACEVHGVTVTAGIMQDILNQPLYNTAKWAVAEADGFANGARWLQ